MTTTYLLLLKDQFENEIESNLTIIVNPLPVIDLVPDGASVMGDTIITCVRDTVVLDAGYDYDPPNTEYFWTKSNLSNRYYTGSTNDNWIDFQTHAVRVTNGETGCINSDSITIMFDFNECAISVPENQSNTSGFITIHPNPNDGSFTITVTREISDVEVKIFNTQGRLLQINFWKGDYTVGYSKQIIADIPSGIYYVHFLTGKESLVKKIIVERN